MQNPKVSPPPPDIFVELKKVARVTRSDAETARLIAEDPDFVALPRYGNSLAQVIERYPDGAPLHVVAKALQMREDEAEDLEALIIAKLREEMKV